MKTNPILVGQGSRIRQQVAEITPVKDNVRKCVQGDAREILGHGERNNPGSLDMIPQD